MRRRERGFNRPDAAAHRMGAIDSEQFALSRGDHQKVGHH
jgi:hypothetical protein